MRTLNHTLSAWKDVLAQLGRCQVSWRGISLSDRDQRTYTEAIVLCALHLTDLSTQFDGVGSHRDIVAWTKLMVTLDVHDVGSFLSDAITCLRNVYKPMTYKQFKRCLSKDYPFTGAFLNPIRGALSSFLGNPTGRGFYVCYQFLSFLTHLTLLDVNVDLENEYEELESYLENLSYSKTMLMEMNSIMREWMGDFSLTEETFQPSHGPGAVAELSATAGQLEKYRYLGSDQLLEYVFKKGLGVDVTSYFPLSPKSQERCLTPYPELGLERKSKIVFVPKSMKTRRTISKEPATLMFLQQGVSRALVDFIHNHPYLSSHIDLRRQEMNGALALEGSKDGRYATIDLSSASDTVTTTLVKAVFYGTPVYPYLVALRSRTAELPSGKAIPVAKYAPMGSALCFPIETLIFACAVEFTVRRARRTHLGFFPVWRVYGDDIIVQGPLFEDTLLTLGGLGFITNQSKSFSLPHRFRESCGVEGYDGIRVTPMKISRRYQAVKGRITHCHAAQYEGLIAMANDANSYGFSLLRAWLIRVLLDNQVAPPLFSREGNGSILSSWPDNYRARHRMNFHLWREEVEVAMSWPKSVKQTWDPDLERCRYFETLRLTSKRSGDMFEPEHRVQVLRSPKCTKLVKRWVWEQS